MTGLAPYFPPQNVYTSALVAKGKPAPDLFLYAAREQGGIDPSRSLVIEDTVAGVTAGIAAGMTVIGFTGAHREIAGYAEKLVKCGASVTMNAWNEFPALFETKI
jgi:beta-phosphoglucomutase-like phosphatase (HAD superfamily)